MGSASMGAARSVTTTCLNRHNYGHEMMQGGPLFSLPSRLTESTVWSKDRPNYGNEMMRVGC